MPRERLAEGLAAPGVPQAQGPVPTAGDDGAAVGAEGHARHPFLMPLERWTDGLAALGVPPAQGPV